MIKEVHIFKAGKQTSAQGVTREFTVGDLKEIASSYRPEVHEAPIRIGHEDNDKVPAWGWVKDVKVKGDELFAEIDFSPLAAEYVNNGLYKKVSASFYSPDSKINPEPGKWSLRHVALLGAQPPAVKGLKGFAYEEHSDGVLDFAVTLTPDQVFDKELGPTLKRDLGPLEILKEKLDEARSQMIEEEKGTEQQLEAPQIEEVTAEEEQFGEGRVSHMGMMAKTKKKPMGGGKMGHEGEDDNEEDEDSVMSAEMAGKDLPEPLKKQAAKKMAKSRGISEDEAMGEKDMDYMSCGSKGKKMNYEETDSTEHGEATAEHDGKVKGLKAPAPKGMSDLSPETVDGEGPEASKVKKNPKSGACDPECEDDDKKYEEPTFEADKKKRGTDHLNASDVGTKETEGGPGGLVRTRSTSKGINLGYEEADEEDLEDDDEQHVETDNNKYVDKTTEPKRGKDGLKGRKAQDPYNDQSGRGELGKAGVEGETDRGMKGTAPEIKGFPDGKGQDSAKGSDGGEMSKNYEDAYKGQSSGQDEDRKMTGKHAEIEGYPGKYMTLGSPKGGGKQIKGGKVRVMEINHSESDPIAQMMARLEELEAANARLREQAEYAERQANRMRLEQFAEGLYESGKLTDAIVAQGELVEYLEGLEYGTLEFAEGETAATPLMKILENLPAQVCYSEVAGGEPIVREEDLNPHERAVKLSKEENIDYTEALKQVLFTA